MIELNYVAILLATVASMLIGAVWYSKYVFGPSWMKLVDLDEKKAKEGMLPAMTGSVVLVFIMNYVLAHFLIFLNAQTWNEALILGLWIWLGFIATNSLSNVLYTHKPIKLWFIDSGYRLVEILVSVMIISSL
jgi:hypothetical protein